MGPYFNAEVGQAVGSMIAAQDAMLLGRVTYDTFAAHWPHQTGEMADTMNGTAKYVVSGTLTSADWQNTTVIPRDRAGQPVCSQRQPGRGIMKAFAQITKRITPLPASLIAGDRAQLAGGLANASRPAISAGRDSRQASDRVAAQKCHYRTQLRQLPGLPAPGHIGRVGAHSPQTVMVRRLGILCGTISGGLSLSAWAMGLAVAGCGPAARPRHGPVLPGRWVRFRHLAGVVDLAAREAMAQSDGQPSRILYIVALGVNVLICRAECAC